MPSRTQQPIAIIGLASRFPGGPDEATFWDLLSSGRCAIGPVPPERFSTAALAQDAIRPISSDAGGFIADVDRFDAEFFGISPDEARVADPQQRLMLELSYHALESAGIDVKSLAASRTGVYMGVSTWDYNKLINRDLSVIDGYVGVGSSLSVLANRISYFFDLRGPSMALDTGCSSVIVGLQLATQALQAGDIDLALVGGINLILSPETSITFSAAGFVSPSGRCKTFDEDADGYVRSEGAGVLVLRRLHDAEQRGESVAAIVRGVAVNQDGQSNGLTSPNGAAQQAVIREALARAAVAPHEISYVETNGTATPLGDAIEVSALKQVLSEGRAPDRACLLGAVKANIGHTEAAAGMAALVKVVLAMRHGAIPPQPPLQRINPRIAATLSGTGLAISERLTPWGSDGPRYAAVSAFAFGGTNGHVILEAPREAAQPERVRPFMHVLKLSARGASAFRQLARAYATELSPVDELGCADFCFSANLGRSDLSHRRLLIAESRVALVEQLEALADAGEIAASYRKAKVAFVFPPQSYSVRLACELYAGEPAFRAAYDRALAQVDADTREAELARLAGREGPPTPAEFVRFAAQYALSELLQSWGIKPTASAGAGVGRALAAVVAGTMPLAEAATLASAQRAEAEPPLDLTPLRERSGTLLLTLALPPEHERRAAYALLAEAYTGGAPVDLAAAMGGVTRRRVAVPVYPFQRTRHWLQFSERPLIMAPAREQRPVPVLVAPLES